MSLTKKELKPHQDKTACYICGKRFIKKVYKRSNHMKIRDHCHYTGKYRDAAYVPI